jgi:hypothetical protein
MLVVVDEETIRAKAMKFGANVTAKGLAMPIVVVVVLHSSNLDTLSFLRRA